MSFQHSSFQHNALQTGLPGISGGAASPTVNNDQPNPVLRVSFFATCLALTACFGTPNILPLKGQTQERELVSTRYEPRKVQQPDLVPNILPLTQTVAQAPFDQTDWPNPVLRTRMVIVDPIPDLLTSTLNQAVNHSPFQNFDQPAPTLARKVQQPQLLPTTPLIATNPIPFDQTDWPNPAPKPRTVQPERPPDLLTSTLDQAATHAPFIQTNQPNPILRVRTVQPEIPAVSPNLATNPIPFDQTNWPNPTLARKVQQPPDPSNLSGTTLAPVVGNPFYQNDQPNPVKRLRTQRTDVPPSFLALTTVVAVGNPFSQDDWPNPVLRTRTVQPELPPNPTINFPTISYQAREALTTRYTPRKVFQWDQPGNRLPLLSAIAAQQPFSQDDWQNPRGRPTWLKAQQLHILRYADPVPQNPFFLNNQPNPVIKGNRVHLEVQTVALTLKFFDPVHRRPLSTPVPRKRMVQPEIVGNLLPLVTPPLKPVTPSDFPNPVLRVRTVQPEIPANILGTTTLPGAPFYQNTWPNPVLSKWLQGYWVFQFDRLNLSKQPVVWSGINDAQTPGWTATGEACTFDSTTVTWDSTTVTFDTDCRATWGSVNETLAIEACTADSTTATADTTLTTADVVCICTADQTAATADDTTVTADTYCDAPVAWAPVDDSDVPGWGPINDTNDAGWSVIDTNPAGVAAQ